MPYDHKIAEPKWQSRWERENTFATDSTPPSRSSTSSTCSPIPRVPACTSATPRATPPPTSSAATSAMRGFNVLHPMGWDAFGLPAEQYAIKTGIAPARRPRRRTSTTFAGRSSRSASATTGTARSTPPTRLLSSGRSGSSCKLFERGLAYRTDVAPINWCPHDRTVLANEEVKTAGGARGTRVVRRDAARSGCCGSPPTPSGCWTTWIARLARGPSRRCSATGSAAARARRSTFARRRSAASEPILVFTTRPDTLFGATYMVLAPEHPLVDVDHHAERSEPRSTAYCADGAHKSDCERTEAGQDEDRRLHRRLRHQPGQRRATSRSGSPTTCCGYGTGAIMAVPGARRARFRVRQGFGLPIVHVVAPKRRSDDRHGPRRSPTTAAVVDGELGESRRARRPTQAKERIIEWLEERGPRGSRRSNYKLRDWLFSRQRYWGEPIPDRALSTTCGVVPVPDDQTCRCTLPELERLRAVRHGESPLVRDRVWVDTTCPQCGRRGTPRDQHDAAVGGLVLVLPALHRPQERPTRLGTARAKRCWMPVDLYVGGAEHAVLHLLYARFWHKVLFDAATSPRRSRSRSCATRE